MKLFRNCISGWTYRRIIHNLLSRKSFWAWKALCRKKRWLNVTFSWEVPFLLKKRSFWKENPKTRLMRTGQDSLVVPAIKKESPDRGSFFNGWNDSGEKRFLRVRRILARLKWTIVNGTPSKWGNCNEWLFLVREIKTNESLRTANNPRQPRRSRH